MRRVNLLRAHGSLTGYLYYKCGCRCVACRAALAEHTRNRRAEHRDELAEYSRKYCAEHPEETAEYKRKYRAEHKEEMAEYNRNRWAENREEMTEYNRTYYKENREDVLSYHRDYRAAHPEDMRRKYLLRKYGMSPEQWDAMFASQGERCKCCGDDDPGSKDGWQTDHNHKTGIVRGILCHGCNSGLGKFRDDPRRVLAGFKYLMAATL